MGTTAATFRRLQRDERGATYVEWMYPLVVLVVLGAMMPGQVAGKWEHARMRLPIDLSLPVLDLLP